MKLDELTQIQYAAVLYQLQHPQATYAEIAREVGIAKTTLEMLRLKQIADECRSDVTAVLLKEFEVQSVRAIGVLGALLDSADEKIRHAAAVKILEWQHGKPTQRTENVNLTATINIVETGMDVDRL